MSGALAWRVLYDLELEELEDCVDGWKSVADNTDSEAEDFVSGEAKLESALGAASDHALYSPGAQAALGECESLRGRLADAAVEADAVRQVLADGVDELRDVRDRFRNLVQDIGGTKGPWGTESTYTVKLDSEEVQRPHPPPDYPPDEAFGGEWSEACAGELQAFVEELEGLAREAGGVDADISSWLLNNAVNQSDFNGEAVNEVPSVKEAIEAADEVADTIDAAMEDGEVTKEEMEEVDALLEEHADNPHFATHLMTELGPAGLAEFNAMSVMSTTEGSFEQAQSLQENLGQTLATAVDSDNEPSLDSEWRAELMDYGRQVHTYESTNVPHVEAYGYSTLAPLMEHGEYDADFIVPVADHMLQLHAENIDTQFDRTAAFDLDDSLSQNGDPDLHVSMATGALTGLGNSPEAATEFFRDGREARAYRDAEGEWLDVVADPLEYVLDETMEGSDLGQAGVGAALEAAATGMPAGASGEDPPEHTADMADIATRVITHVGENPEQYDNLIGATGASELANSFANITLSYMSDIYAAYLPPHTDELWVPTSHGVPLGLDGMSPEADSNPLLDEWLQVIGHDESALFQVQGGMDAVAGQALSGAAATEDPQGHLPNAARPYGYITSQLANGMWEGIRDEAFNDSSNARVDLLEAGSKYAAGQLPGGSESLATFDAAGVDPIGDLFDLIRDDPDISSQEEFEDFHDNRSKPKMNSAMDSILSKALNDIDGSEEDIANLYDDVIYAMHESMKSGLYKPFE